MAGFPIQLRNLRLHQRLRERLEAARLPLEPRVVDPAEWASLPPPVQRYFRLVLRPGAAMVAGVRIHHRGTFNLGSRKDRWKPFSSDQLVITRRPGFDWSARVRMMPGLSVRVHDAYIAGEGILHAVLGGLVTVADQHGTGEFARGELLRFLAEAAWYPTALLPSQGVRWEAVNDHSAKATLVDGLLTVTMVYRFDQEGMIETVRADARGRMEGRAFIPTPWEGRFRDHQECSGMRIPLEGEVAWLLPEGRRPYWRGRIVDIAHLLAD